MWDAVAPYLLFTFASAVTAIILLLERLGK